MIRFHIPPPEQPEPFRFNPFVAGVLVALFIAAAFAVMP